MSASSRSIIVVGAGVAGLAAAAALAECGAGVNVTLLERRPYVGGRAYSYLHPALNEVVDSQHVLVGCCTNLIDICNAAGLADKVRWYDRQTYLEPATATRPVRATTIEIDSLPAPFHYSGSFLRASMLSFADKLAIARALAPFSRGPSGSDDESVARWYVRTRQPQSAIRHFWDPLLLAILNDTAENCSMKYASKVFYELFLKTRTGGRLGIPTLPLSDFYAATADLVRARGGVIELRNSVDQLIQQPGSDLDARWLLRSGEHTYTAHDVILALPFEQTRRLLSTMSLADPSGEPARAALLAQMAHFTHSPYISIQLWYDREITDLDHAWLLDSTIQWFFHKSRIRATTARVPHSSQLHRDEWGANTPPNTVSYIELVIAGSHAALNQPREQVLASALAELERFFPRVRQARLLKSGILKEARATFSVTPGLDAHRPAQRTALPGLYLAGDWTATDWPSTMEGAARSGRLAAGALLADSDSLANPTRFLTPDLPATGLMRLLAR